MNDAQTIHDVADDLPTLSNAQTVHDVTSDLLRYIARRSAD